MGSFMRLKEHHDKLLLVILQSAGFLEYNNTFIEKVPQTASIYKDLNSLGLGFLREYLFPQESAHQIINRICLGGEYSMGICQEEAFFSIGIHCKKKKTSLFMTL